MPEALIASTINAAASLGLADSHGSLEIGKNGDMLILNTPRFKDERLCVCVCVTLFPLHYNIQLGAPDLSTWLPSTSDSMCHQRRKISPSKLTFEPVQFIYHDLFNNVIIYTQFKKISLAILLSLLERVCVRERERMRVGKRVRERGGRRKKMR